MDLLYFDNALKYIAKTFLHLYDRTISLISELLVRIQINSFYLHLTLYIKIMYIIRKIYVLYIYGLMNPNYCLKLLFSYKKDFT